MENPNIGDYVINNDGVWEITDCKSEYGVVTYDITLITSPGEFLELYNWAEEKYEKAQISPTLTSVSLSYLRHLGKIIPKSEAGNSVEILFKST